MQIPFSAQRQASLHVILVRRAAYAITIAQNATTLYLRWGFVCLLCLCVSICKNDVHV